jgi:hypothetical protein
MYKVWWYKVNYSDQRGAVHLREGDVSGTNLLNAMKKVEGFNKNLWKGTLVSVQLNEIDMETGHVKSPCEVYWTRHGANGESVRNMDFTEVEAPKETSHSVTPEVEKPEEFNPYALGYTINWKKPTFTLATLKPKSEED